jgi:hypothetical protein
MLHRAFWKVHLKCVQCTGCTGWSHWYNAGKHPRFVCIDCETHVSETIRVTVANFLSWCADSAILYNIPDAQVVKHYNCNLTTFQRNIGLNLQPWRWRQYVHPKRWYLPTNPHYVTAQKTNIDIFTAVRTSNLIPHYTIAMFVLNLSIP